MTHSLVDMGLNASPVNGPLPFRQSLLVPKDSIYFQDLAHLSSTKAQANKKVDELADRTNNILYQVSTVFPFDFFPTQIVIDENQVNIIYWHFFFNKEIFTILIKNIFAAKVSTSPFFATLELEVIGYEQKNPPAIKYLWKNHALRARRIIMGLVTCDKEKVDFASLSREEALAKVEEIGAAHSG